MILSSSTGTTKTGIYMGAQSTVVLVYAHALGQILPLQFIQTSIQAECPTAAATAHKKDLTPMKPMLYSEIVWLVWYRTGKLPTPNTAHLNNRLDLLLNERLIHFSQFQSANRLEQSSAILGSREVRVLQHLLCDFSVEFG